MRERLYYLDIIRGVASIIVACLYHYVHFSDTIQSNFSGNVPPFFRIQPFSFLYYRGELMVDVFFVLSGIVFSYTYQVAIEKGKIGEFDFFVKRFSRLYPIHILTLMMTACIVYSFYHCFNTYPIYLNNDLYHFILNILFLQRGYADTGYSFNGPAWSLSIEVLMYFLFFIQAKYFKSIVLTAVFACTGILIFRFIPIHSNFLINIDVSRGLMGFFSGCLLYEFFLKSGFLNKKQKSLLLLFAFTYFVYLTYLCLFINIPLNIQVIIILFIVIPYLHHNEWLRIHSKIHLLVLLGDISLAIYMIHVPIQMLIIFYYKINEKIIPYNSSTFFLTYSFFVFLSGYTLHYYFERPVQSWLRRSMTRERR